MRRGDGRRRDERRRQERRFESRDRQVRDELFPMWLHVLLPPENSRLGGKGEDTSNQLTLEAVGEVGTWVCSTGSTCGEGGREGRRVSEWRERGGGRESWSSW